MKILRLKRLIFIRHAHRDTTDRELDNGLSEKGRSQVKKLVKLAREELGEKPFNQERIEFLTSPKRRCVETISPIAEELGGEIGISGLLDEGDRLEKRVDEFLEWWRSPLAPLVTVLCSHGDWIPLCLKRLTGQEQDISKGGWAEVSLSIWDGP